MATNGQSQAKPTIRLRISVPAHEYHRAAQGSPARPPHSEPSPREKTTRDSGRATARQQSMTTRETERGSPVPRSPLLQGLSRAESARPEQPMESRRLLPSRPTE